MNGYLHDESDCVRNVLSLWILPAALVNGQSWILRYLTLPLMVAMVRRNRKRKDQGSLASRKKTLSLVDLSQV
jgi:hypothetical protein